MTETVTYEELGYRINYTVKELWVEFEIWKDLCNGDDKVASGYLKWDGCMNIQTDGIAHFCGEDAAANFGKLFTVIYDKAEELGVLE
jgi:hypothetical protein